MKPPDVTISASSTCDINTKHESTGRPFISTVQAPHSPFPQSSFGPVTFNLPRKTSRRVWAGGADTETSCPFSLNENRFSKYASSGLLSPLSHPSAHCPDDRGVVSSYRGTGLLTTFIVWFAISVSLTARSRSENRSRRPGRPEGFPLGGRDRSWR